MIAAKTRKMKDFWKLKKVFENLFDNLFANLSEKLFDKLFDFIENG